MDWFRLYHSVLGDPKVQQLDGETFKAWVNLLCVASANEPRGVFTADIAQLAWMLRTSESDMAAIVGRLKHAGLLEELHHGALVLLHPHAWETRQHAGDSSTARVREFRQRHGLNGHATLGNVRGNRFPSVSVSDLSLPDPDPDQREGKRLQETRGKRRGNVSPVREGQENGHSDAWIRAGRRRSADEVRQQQDAFEQLVDTELERLRSPSNGDGAADDAGSGPVARRTRPRRQ